MPPHGGGGGCLVFFDVDGVDEVDACSEGLSIFAALPFGGVEKCVAIVGSEADKGGGDSFALVFFAGPDVHDLSGFDVGVEFADQFSFFVVGFEDVVLGGVFVVVGSYAVGDGVGGHGFGLSVGFLAYGFTIAHYATYV